MAMCNCWIAGVVVLFCQCTSVTCGFNPTKFIDMYDCTRGCFKNACQQTDIISTNEVMVNQPWSRWLLQWDCEAECRYICMWPSVKFLQKIDRQINQYYGKWPFIEFLGMQEPASAIFSALHGVANYIMFQRIRKEVPPRAPMYKVIYWYPIVSINAWIWSTAFHSRDLPFTEKMDYYCAISLVLYSVFTLCARLIYSLRLAQCWITLSFTAIFLFYCYHVGYLHLVKFDYRYNMHVLVTTGVINTAGWLLFCTINYKTQPQVKKALLSFFILNIFLFFEIYDFPPILWIFDAHSIWHGGTIVVPLLFLRFLIDDSIHLLKYNQNKDIIANNILLQNMVDNNNVIKEIIVIHSNHEIYDRKKHTKCL